MRSGSQFKTSLAKAMDNVDGSLRRFASDSGKKLENVMISSNFSLAERKPEDPGVSCFFTWDGLDTCICVDRYNKLEDNLQAIHHCLEAERTKLRHGGINLVRAAFRGYAALPPPTTSAEPWYEILKVQENSIPLLVEGAYKKARSVHHPDNGGDAAMFQKVNRAWAEFKSLS